MVLHTVLLMNAECKEGLVALLKWHHTVGCTCSMITGCGEAEQHGAKSNTKISSSRALAQQTHRSDLLQNVSFHLVKGKRGQEAQHS